MQTNFTPTIYKEYIDEHDFPAEIPAHALLFYSLSLNLVLENNQHQYSHEKLFKVEAENIMRSTETMYGVNRTHMIKFWKHVDALYDKLKLQPIPIKLEYRFKSVLEIESNKSDIIMPNSDQTYGMKKI